MTRKSAREIASVQPGLWPEDENNPFLKPLNKKAERVQESGSRK